MQVEVGVAGDERVERPADRGTPTGQRPLALVLLEHPPNAASLVLDRYAGDVRVQVAVLGEEAGRGTAQSRAVVGAGEVVASVRQGVEHGRVAHPLIAVDPPDPAEQGCDLVRRGRITEFDDLHGTTEKRPPRSGRNTSKWRRSNVAIVRVL